MAKDKNKPVWLSPKELSLEEMLKLAEGIEDWSFTYGWLNYGLDAGVYDCVGIIEFEPIGDIAIVVGINEKHKLVGTRMGRENLEEVYKTENYGFIRVQSLNIFDGRRFLGLYSDEGAFNEKTRRFVPDKRLIELYERAEKSCRGDGQKICYDSEKYASKVIARIRGKNEMFILEQARSLIK